jgi:cytochrome c553
MAAAALIGFPPDMQQIQGGTNMRSGAVLRRPISFRDRYERCGAVPTGRRRSTGTPISGIGGRLARARLTAYNHGLEIAEAFMRILALIGVLAIAAAIGAGVFFLGGFYDVAANKEDHPIVKWVLEQTRTASIARHATVSVPAGFNDQAKVQAGAREYSEHGCTHCHGAPGVKWDKFSEGLHPDPPDLKEVVTQLSPAELFWVVRNGINMTGMPSFAAAGVKDEEIWEIVAFLTKLPSISEADYKALQAPARPASPVTTLPPSPGTVPPKQ